MVCGITFLGIVPISPDSIRRYRKRAIIRQHASVKRPGLCTSRVEDNTRRSSPAFSRGLRPLPSQAWKQVGPFLTRRRQGPRKVGAQFANPRSSKGQYNRDCRARGMFATKHKPKPTLIHRPAEKLAASVNSDGATAAPACGVTGPEASC